MLPEKVNWNIKTLIAVYVLRIVLGLLIVQTIYPLFTTVTSFMVEMTDRIIVILLVWLVISRGEAKFSDLGLAFQSVRYFVQNSILGVTAGVLLLFASIFSEQYYTTWLLLTPAPHPLALQAQYAGSWQQLLPPLFLAGIAAPVSEEILYRLFTFLPLKERWGVWGGAFGSAAIFTLMHFNVYWLGEMMVVGTGLALLYSWRGSLISAIWAHAFVNISKMLMIFWGISPV
ncbi:putative membrane protein [Propionispora sp. 2/2-37]|uniref:CPBP family intramembrane glutamic endopeptidase n=1 Tax=Propionispora sp. 2/2-37 TaxID=1677858 RepID=UPI0006BB88BD|nr:CPBP family intramembrane glutamic endopeptidase [Propionispora sp. 2/2-37]CUH96359.1 putative membrane protein [Propionispora sp. 2/2-37]